ncbi:MAG: class I SAM-dependent methyltransferase [Chitinophagales bacterium]
MVDPHVNNPKSPKFHVKRYLVGIKDELKGKIVLDLPAGNGVTSEILHELGSKVEAYDLFPEYFLLKNMECKKADINEGLPLANDYADYIICQEGIEHFSDQLKAFSEFNRVLKVGGKLIITTPSYSNLAAKLSYALFETEYFHKLMPPNEIDSVWFGDKANRKIYYGHIFLLGVQKMRVIARVSGFKISRIIFMRLNKTALFLFPFYYPIIFFSSYYTYFKAMRKNKTIDHDAKKKVYKEQLQINLSPKVLLDRHTFIVFEKEFQSGNVYDHLLSILKPLDEIL